MSKRNWYNYRPAQLRTNFWSRFVVKLLHPQNHVPIFGHGLLWNFFTRKITYQILVTVCCEIASPAKSRTNFWSRFVVNSASPAKLPTKFWWGFI